MDFDTSELIKRRQENEAYLEEIEKSIIENIEGTRNILEKSKTPEKEKEVRPFTDSPSKFEKYLHKSLLPSTKSKLNYHKHSKKPLKAPVKNPIEDKKAFDFSPQPIEDFQVSFTNQTDMFD
jgi:hypothetical protein